MIRMVLGLFIFTAVLCAYIVNTQHGGILPEPTPFVEQTQPETSPVTVAAPEETSPKPDVTAVQILDALVTRDLGFVKSDVPVGLAVRDTLTVLRLETSAGAESPPDQRFARLINEALKQGTPDAEIIQTVNATARAGGLAIPAGLVQANEMIDTATFIKAVLTTAF